MSIQPLAAGVWGVLATPFSADGSSVDRVSLQRQVRHYRSVGAAGLTVLGVFGEAAALSSAEQRDVVTAVAEAADGLPLVVGLPAQATRPAVEQATAAVASAGAAMAGVMVQVNTADPERLGDHLRAVHAGSGAGVVVQDYPLVSGVRIPPLVLADVVSACADFVVAVKSESPPTPPAIAALTARVSVPVFGGLGGVGLLDELSCGAAGAMTGFSFPEALVATVRAFGSGGFSAARDVWAPWLPLVNFEAQQGISLAVRKSCLQARGLIDHAAARPPAAPLPPSLAELVKAHVAAADSLLAAA